MNQQFSPILHSIDGSCGCRHEGSLDAAWSEAEAALPYKRFAVFLSGNQEDGWKVELTSCAVGGKDVTHISLPDEHWGYIAQGFATPAAAFRALTVQLRESVTRTVTDAVDRVGQSEPE